MPTAPRVRYARLLAIAIVALVAAGALALPPTTSFNRFDATPGRTTAEAHAVNLAPALTPGGSAHFVANGRVSGESSPDGSPPLGVLATISLATNSSPIAVAVDTSTGNLYVSEMSADSVAVISGSTNSILSVLPVGLGPTGVAYNPTNGEVYVANYYSGNVSVIDATTNSIVAAAISSPDAFPGGPVGMTVDPGNDTVFVTNQNAAGLGNDTVSVIAGSSNTVTGSIPVGPDPIAAAFDTASNSVFVANLNGSSVSVINATTNLVTATVPVGKWPLGVAYDQGNGDVYVSNYLSNNTTVIDGASDSVVGSVYTPGLPVGVAYSPALSLVAVTEVSLGQTTFINDTTNSVVENVTVGSDPNGIAYSPVTDDFYVVNSNSNTVSVIGTALVPPVSVTFTESGLPSGTSWSVTLAGSTESGTGSSISFNEANGTYAYTVAPVAGYNATPSSGSIIVQGFPQTVAVTFGPYVYGVTFLESGLSAGDLWSVLFNGNPGVSNVTTIVFTSPNGTIPFEVGTVGNLTPAPSIGNVTIHGGPTTVSITFTNESSHSSGSSSGLPSWIWIVVIVVVVAAVVGIVVALRRRPPAASNPPPPQEWQEKPPAQ